MKNNRLFIYLLAILSMLFWSSTFVWYKIAYLYYKPLTLITLRTLVAIIFLSLFTKFFRRTKKVDKKDWKYFLLMAFLEPFCYFLGESFGMLYVTATLGAIIISTIPLFTPFFTYFILNEKITRFGIFGLLISFAGVVLIVSGNFSGNYSLKGIILLLFAVFSAVNYGIILRRIAGRYSSFTIVRNQNIIAFFYFLPLFFIIEWKHFITVVPNLQIILTIIKLSIFGTCLAFIFITIVIRNIGLNNTNIFTNLIPVFTAVISFFVLKEAFDLMKIAGILIVISGLFLSQYPYLRKIRSKRRFHAEFH